MLRGVSIIGLSAVTDVPIHLAVLILAVCFAGSFVCLVPTDHAPGRSPNQPMMTGEMSGRATNDRSLNAALGFRCGDRRQGKN